MTISDEAYDALCTAESILSLLHHRGIIDSEANREDVARALTEVRAVLKIGGTYIAKPMPERKKWYERF